MNNLLTRTLIVSALVLFVATFNIKQASDTDSMMFQNWKKQYQMDYQYYENMYRFIIFKQNIKIIHDHNSKTGNSYQLGYNKFMGLSKQEWANTYLSSQSNIKIANLQHIKEVTVEVDWVSKGVVAPVQNSGGACAASYATSAIGALQSLRIIKQGKQTIGLSKQEIIDCSSSYGNQGCGSGLPVNAFRYVVDHGISTASEYPYTGTSAVCKKQFGTFKISGYAQIKNSCEDLQNHLMKQPVSVLVDASKWMLYKSGIYNQCSESTLNHAVLLVGMSDTYWKLQNSWGTSWGEQGYIRLQMGNCCGVCQLGSIPLK